MSVPANPTLDSVRAAARRISRVTNRTPVRVSNQLSEIHGAPVMLKLETTQPTGSFKVRGAANAVLRQGEEGAVTGVVTASTGNHGRAVAYIARTLGLDAVVCLSSNVPQDRIDSIRAEGAQVDIVDGDQSAAIRRGMQLAEDGGRQFVTPFDDPDIISGQGTIGLELHEQIPDLETVLVPVSGGGLAAGVGLAIKSLAPQTRVIAVSADRTPTMARSVAAGQPVATEEVATIAGSLMGDLGPDNRYSFRIVQEFVDDVVLIEEDEIRDAMRWTLRNERLVVEGAAAVVVAYVLGRTDNGHGGTTAAIITGDNVPSESLESAARCL
ncbi:MAG: pyridoxal-phosphate dependent enzyme [Rubrobacter sp.]|nr:pyridoxal-phosphate dependent enzyme [Rubrobacter sp.]